MNLGDLLTELRENVLHDRSDQIAGASDYLWSDATLVRYIDEAQKRFARKALVIRDGQTKQVCQVAIKTGVEEYPLDASVLGVLSVRLTGDTADLARAGHAAFDTYRTPDTYYFDPATLAQLPPGKPRAYSTDEFIGIDEGGTSEAEVLRIYPAPTATYNGQILKLRVVRLPLNDLTVDNLEMPLEIPSIHHIEILDWAAYLALRIVDADGGNPQRAEEFRASFEDHVQKARAAAQRKLFAPLNWGFGRNGFSWEGN